MSYVCHDYDRCHTDSIKSGFVAQYASILYYKVTPSLCYSLQKNTWQETFLQRISNDVQNTVLYKPNVKRLKYIFLTKIYPSYNLKIKAALPSTTQFQGLLVFRYYFLNAIAFF